MLGSWIKQLQASGYSDSEINSIARTWVMDADSPDSTGAYEAAWQVVRKKVDAVQAASNQSVPEGQPDGAMNSVAFEVVAQEITTGASGC